MQVKLKEILKELNLDHLEDQLKEQLGVHPANLPLSLPSTLSYHHEGALITKRVVLGDVAIS